MKLTNLANATPYVGLYVVELNGQTAVGYTAEEVATLLESEANRTAKVFRIYRAWPNGQMELVGVHPERFQLESGLFFFRDTESAARADYEALLTWAGEHAAPCRAKVQLAHLAGQAGGEYCVALIYPAEYEEDVSAWLSAGNYAGGEQVEGGISAVTTYQEAKWDVLAGEQLWPMRPSAELAPRSREDLLAAVGQPLQRKLA